MEPQFNTAKEKQIGIKYANKIQSIIRNTIRNENLVNTGAMLKTKVTSKIKNKRLQRLVITAPKHTFIQHYGFEGVRSNGRFLALQPKQHLQVLTDSLVLNGLASEIASTRAEQVVATINFK